MEERLLYEYNYEKPDISEEFFKHYGTPGMRWGVRNGPPYPIAKFGNVLEKTFSKGTRYKAAKRAHNRDTSSYKDNETALKERDLGYISSHKGQFSSKEMNDLMNRIQTEQRMDQMYSAQRNATKDKVKKVLSSPAGKAVAGVAVSALAVSTYSYAKAYENAIATGGTVPPVGKIFKDIPSSAKKVIDGTMKKKYGKFL